MKKMYIYEGAMCCSTGVCGPSPDEELMRVSTLVDKLTKSGASIERYNLTNNTNHLPSLYQWVRNPLPPRKYDLQVGQSAPIEFHSHPYNNNFSFPPFSY